MNLRKFIIRKLVERWIAKEPNDKVQGVMNMANVLLWDDGRCRVGLRLNEQHTDTRGVLHTGMAILVADVTCALALLSHPEVIKRLTYPYPSLVVPSTVNLSFSFFDTSATLGKNIIVEANLKTIALRRFDQEFHTNSPLAYLDVDITDTESNVLLVKGNMLMHIEALGIASNSSD